MTTHDREQVQVPTRGGEGDPARPGVDELQVRFPGQPDPGCARERSRQARNARGVLMAAGAMMALMCLLGIAGAVNSGAQSGLWAVAYVMGLGFSGSGVELARRGRTHMALMTIIFGAVGATLGNALP